MHTHTPGDAVLRTPLLMQGCTLCQPSVACWRRTGGTMPGAPSWAYPAPQSVRTSCVQCWRPCAGRCGADAHHPSGCCMPHTMRWPAVPSPNLGSRAQLPDAVVSSLVCWHISSAAAADSLVGMHKWLSLPAHVVASGWQSLFSPCCSSDPAHRGCRGEQVPCRSLPLEHARLQESLMPCVCADSRGHRCHEG